MEELDISGQVAALRSAFAEIRATVDPDRLAADIASYGQYAGHPSTEVRVVAPLPLIGLIGFERGLEVVGHAALETLD